MGTLAESSIEFPIFPSSQNVKISPLEKKSYDEFKTFKGVIKPYAPLLIWL